MSVMKIGFIGCGNMGGALVKAAASTDQDNIICICDHNPDKIRALSEETAARSASAEDIAQSCDFIFLGVKPNKIMELVSELRDRISSRSDRCVLVSMAAGIETSMIAEAAGDIPIIRIMPNLAVSVGEGVILYSGCNTEAHDIEAFIKIMSGAGALVPIEERLMDAGSAISGCGPAFVCMFIEALADGGVAAGLKRETAQQLAAQTLAGTAMLMLETGVNPGELKDSVCSPGGTTIEGVLALEERGFRGAAASAVLASYKKNRKLCK